MRRVALAPALAALLLAAGALGAGIGIAAEEVLGDIRFERKGGGTEPSPALFQHWVHRIRFRCYVCHDDIFRMKAGANDVTMDAIGEGKLCGACHDGKTAFAVAFETCGRCHRE